MDEIAKQLKEIIDKILSTGDWKVSAFLQIAESKLKELQAENQRLIEVFSPETKEQKAEVVKKSIAISREIPEGCVQVCVLLYQVDYTDLKKWYHDIVMLASQCSTKTVYKEEAHAQELIRSKTIGIEHNGYVLVNVKKDDFYDTTAPAVDLFGHNLFNLKEHSVKLENIVEFIKSNKQHYAIHNNELVLFDG